MRHLAEDRPPSRRFDNNSQPAKTGDPENAIRGRFVRATGQDPTQRKKPRSKESMCCPGPAISSA